MHYASNHNEFLQAFSLLVRCIGMRSVCFFSFPLWLHSHTAFCCASRQRCAQSTSKFIRWYHTYHNVSAWKQLVTMRLDFPQQSHVNGCVCIKTHIMVFVFCIVNRTSPIKSCTITISDSKENRIFFLSIKWLWLTQSSH